jgi:uncharacterized protein YndB with AHSA1/START domain
MEKREIMEATTVERSILIAAPRERVWKAVTEPEQIVQWFLPALPGAALQRDDSGKMAVSLGPMNMDVMIFEAVEAPRQLTSRGLPDRTLATTYTLQEEPDGTRVTITMSGFEALPEDARQDRLNISGSSWEQALDNLKAFVDGKELPFPYAAIAPLFGYWREPKEKLAAERSIWINAPRERVWTALTDPAQVEKWFSPGTPWKLSALEVGGRLFVHNEETGTDNYVQVIEVLDPPHQLVWRTEPEPPDTTHVITYRLDEEKGGTRLTLTDIGYELEAEDVRWMNMGQNTFGFGMMLANLKAYVEGGDLPNPGGF